MLQNKIPEAVSQASIDFVIGSLLDSGSEGNCFMKDSLSNLPSAPTLKFILNNVFD